MSEERVTDLEIRMAFLEETVRTLDQVIQELGGSLDSLRRELREVKESQSSPGSEDLAPMNSTERMLSEKPPHY